MSSLSLARARYWQPLIGPGARFTCLQVVGVMHVASEAHAWNEPLGQLALQDELAE